MKRFWLITVSFAGLFTLGACQGPSQPRDDDASASVGPNTAVLVVHGMGCPQCANNVDTQLLKVPGVEDVSIDMGSGRVLARLSAASPPSRDQLARAVHNTGFTLVSIAMPQPDGPAANVAPESP